MGNRGTGGGSRWWSVACAFSAEICWRVHRHFVVAVDSREPLEGAKCRADIAGCQVSTRALAAAVRAPSAWNWTTSADAMLRASISCSPMGRAGSSQQVSKGGTLKKDVVAFGDACTHAEPPVSVEWPRSDNAVRSPSSMRR